MTGSNRPTNWGQTNNDQEPIVVEKEGETLWIDSLGLTSQILSSWSQLMRAVDLFLFFLCPFVSFGSEILYDQTGDSSGWTGYSGKWGSSDSLLRADDFIIPESEVWQIESIAAMGKFYLDKGNVSSASKWKWTIYNSSLKNLRYEPGPVIATSQLVNVEDDSFNRTQDFNPVLDLSNSTFPPLSCGRYFLSVMLISELPEYTGDFENFIKWGWRLRNTPKVLVLGESFCSFAKDGILRFGFPTGSWVHEDLREQSLDQVDFEFIINGTRSKTDGSLPSPCGFRTIPVPPGRYLGETQQVTTKVHNLSYSAFYRVTLPVNQGAEQVMVASVCGDVTLDIYENCSVVPSNLLCHSSEACSYCSVLIEEASYTISIASSSQSSFSLDIFFEPDILSCKNAEPLDESGISGDVTVIAPKRVSNSPSTLCGDSEIPFSSIPTSSRWYHFQPTSALLYRVTTCDENNIQLDSVISVHRDCDSSKLPIACNDDRHDTLSESCGAFQSSVVFPYEPELYQNGVRIRVYGVDGSTGHFNLSVYSSPLLDPEGTLSGGQISPFWSLIVPILCILCLLTACSIPVLAVIRLGFKRDPNRQYQPSSSNAPPTEVPSVQPVPLQPQTSQPTIVHVPVPTSAPYVPVGEYNNMQVTPGYERVESVGNQSKSQLFPPQKQSLIDVNISYSELKIGELIGEGNFGTVNKGIYHGNDCVVKILKETTSQDQHSELIAEVSQLQKLRPHASICTFYGACLDPEEPLAIVLEFIDGGNLQEIIKTSLLCRLDILSLLKDLASGMIHLHSVNLVHLDLAARNCLVVGKKPLRLKIIDFGLSRVLPSATDSVSLGNTPIPVRWSAPEAFGEEKRVFLGSDTWSFGVVAWECLTQALPYYHLPKNSQVMEYVLSGQRLSKPEQDFGLYDLMSQCWNSDPLSRPSFKDILSILSQWFDDEQANSNSNDVKEDPTPPSTPTPVIPTDNTVYSYSYPSAPKDFYLSRCK